MLHGSAMAFSQTVLSATVQPDLSTVSQTGLYRVSRHSGMFVSFVSKVCFTPSVPTQACLWLWTGYLDQQNPASQVSLTVLLLLVPKAVGGALMIDTIIIIIIITCMTHPSAGGNDHDTSQRWARLKKPR